MKGGYMKELAYYKEHFSLRQIGEMFFVVPKYEEEYRKPMQVNTSGAFLFETILGEDTVEEVVAKLSEQYGESETVLRQDIEQFLESLSDR